MKQDERKQNGESEDMSIPIFQVDAFTNRPFAGNPAAVCLLREAALESWMQCVAMEMNLSETAFLSPCDDGYNLRWFTPVTEVALCGHATLASAHILWETAILTPDMRAKFFTASGLLTARRIDHEIELHFPATVPTPVEPPVALLRSLGITDALYTGTSKFDYIIEVSDEEAVRSLNPDFSSLRSLDIRGVMVTARASSHEFDFVSRFFAPGAGVDEDPVTGSAHCCLAPYWSRILGKEELLAYQASTRGGTLRLRVADGSVHIRGEAITILRGELLEE